MRRILPYLVLLLAAVVPTAHAQYGSAVNQVTVTVNAISWLQVIGATVTLDVTDAIAAPGQDLMTVSHSLTQIQWGTNSSAQKITAQSSLAAPLFALRLLAVSPTVGTAAPEVTLTSVPSDLLLNLGRSMGSAGLRYTADVLASQGTGSDLHTVTFTLTVQ